MRKENSINIFKFHKDNHTMPSQLFMDKWPEIYLSNDQKSVDKRNERYKEFAAILMDDDIARLEEQISELKKLLAQSQ